MIAGAAAVVVLVGGAVATVNLSSSDKSTQPQAAIDAPRSPQDRADRADRPSPSAEAVTAESAGMGSAQVTTPPAPSRTPAKSKTATTPAGTSTTGTCKVSFYSDGQKTANGEDFDPDAMTAANKEWKFGTQVRVTNVANGSSVVVRINDRGPYVSGRCIDLSRGAFQKIASVGAGVITARYEVLK